MYNIIILGLTSLLTDISSEMVYPLIPLYLTARLGATPAIVGLIEGIAESLASLLKVFSGYWSDKVGRRKPLAIAGYSSSTLGKVFLFFSASWLGVLWGRVADRFGKGIRTAPRDALIAESSDPEKLGRAYGLHRAMDTLGASIGVILGYYFLTTYRGDFRPVFLFALVPAVLGVAVLFLAREQKREVSLTRRPPSLNWWALDARLRAFLVVVFLFTLGNSSNQFLLLRAKNLGFSDTTVILLYLTYNLVYSFFSYPAGRVSDRLGRRSVLVAGHLAYALVYLGFAVVSHPTALWYLFGLYGLYSAFTEGVEKALVAEIAPSEQKATLIGLHATLVGIGLLPASLLAGLLWNLFGPRAPFYFGSLMAALAALGLYLVLGGPRPAAQRQG
ncbi:MAG: hypothetical protein PWQ41_80 [Bacillota bacterium]|jgi:MFS family permease|nr:hypothetical protein [Bacillota bacterium]